MKTVNRKIFDKHYSFRTIPVRGFGEAGTGDLYERDGQELRQPGLFVDLEAWQFHFIRVA